MKRELNPSIFGPTHTPIELGRSISAYDDGSPSPIESPAELRSLRGDLLELEKETALEIDRAMKQSQGLANQVGQMFKALSARIDALEKRIVEQHEMSSEQNDVNKKIEDLLARHNQIVRNFENKLVHLNRILSEQETIILQTRAALEERGRGDEQSGILVR